ncbi:hypothetical protein [uncultured Clostridium sp.]|uniref:hypothetical protein n=1 Tax=uncultured Clostridium sp. TaxID=59620 RepID=UPI002604B792|nr:hypothetical protein [uncultured Clostridium sp.]
MNKRAIGLVVAVIIGVAGFALYENNKVSILDKADLIAISPKTGNVDIGELKFIDTETKNTSEGLVLETKVKNETDKKIVGLSYVYSIDGQVFDIESNQILERGQTGDTIETKISKKIVGDKISLVRAKIKYVDNKNEIISEKFVPVI